METDLRPAVRPPLGDPAALEPLLRDAIAEAGAIAMRHFRQPCRRWDKAPGQPVTEADVAIDRHLKARLFEATRADGIAWLSEETEDDPARLEARAVWVVDPIDGTRSFAEGRPEFTISIALVEDGTPRLAALLNPAKDQLFWAERGKGAFLNGAKLEVTPRVELKGAKIAVSEGEDRKHPFRSVFPDAEVVRIGSLAYKMALVAAGRFDAFFSWRRARDWDIAAAALILEEAGGRARDGLGCALRFNEPDPVHKGTIACVPGLEAALVAVAGSGRSSGQKGA